MQATPSKLQIEWERTPLALRLGLLVIMASQLLRFGDVLIHDEDQLLHNGAVMGLFGAAWVAGDLLCLIGAAQLAQRAPRAKLLLWSYAIGLGMVVAWQLFEAVQWSGDFERYASLLTVMRYVSFAETAFAVVAWAMLGRNPVLVIAIAVLLIAGNLPPFADGVYAAAGINSYRGHVSSSGLIHLLATTAMLFVALGVPFERGLVPRVPPSDTYRHAAMGAGIAAVVEAAITAVGGDAGGPFVLFAVLGGTGSFLWLTIVMARARAADQAGAWALHAAAAACGIAGVLHFDMVSAAVAKLHGESVQLHLGELGGLPVMVGAVGVVLALIGVAQAARARGADQARRIANAFALGVVVTGLVSVAANTTDSSSSLQALLVGVVYVIGAIGLSMAGAALGEGELPTATLRSS